MRTAIFWIGIILLLLFLPVFGPHVVPSPEPAALIFLGRFHILFLHLPIGVMVYVTVAEAFHVVRHRRLSLTTIWPLTFVATVVPIVALLGYLLLRNIGSTPLLVRHMWTALFFSSFAIAAFLAKKSSLSLSPGRVANGIYLVFLVAALFLMTISAHDAGSSVYGVNFLTKYAPSWLQKLTGSIPSPASVAAVNPTASSNENLFFLAAVQPILQSKCAGCHSSVDPSGKLDLSNLSGVLKGGRDGVVLVPGHPDQSALIRRMMLPLDDDEHMPPNEISPPDEIAVLRWWIASLATPAASSDHTARVRGFPVSGQTGTRTDSE